MKFRTLKIKKENGEVLIFYPQNIDEIKIGLEKIVIWQFTGQCLKPPIKFTLYKKNYYWPEWRTFINQLETMFKI